MKPIFSWHARLSPGRPLFWYKIAVCLAGLSLALVGCGSGGTISTPCSALPTPTSTSIPISHAHPPGLVSAYAAPSNPQITISGHTSAVYALAAIPPGSVQTSVSYRQDQYLASGSLDKTVLVTNVSKSCQLLSYVRHAGAVNAVAWSPDGEYIASGSDDGTVQIWTLDGREKFSINYDYRTAVRAVAWSLDGRLAFGGDAGTVDVWNLGAGEPTPVARYPGVVRAVAWSPIRNASPFLAFGGDAGIIEILNIGTAQVVASFPNGYGPAVRALAWSPDGQHIASGGDAGTMQIWTLDGKEVFSPIPYPNGSHIMATVRAVAWSPNGRFVAIGGNIGSVEVWELGESLTQIPNIPAYPSIVRAVAWLSDGRLAFGGDADTVEVVTVG